MRNCIISTSDPEKRNTEVVLCFCISGINRSGSFVMSNRVGKLALLNQKPGQVVMRLCVIRPQSNGSPVMIDGLIRFGLLAENDAEIVMRHPTTRILLQGCGV